MAKNGVEGVYDKDPKQFEDAKLYKKLTLEDVIKKELKVMDSTAASICRDNRINIVVFDMNKMRKAVSKEDIYMYSGRTKIMLEQANMLLLEVEDNMSIES